MTVSRITVEKDALVAMRDGVRLATDVYRPADAHDAPVPALLQRTPYDKELSVFRNYTLEVMQAVRAGYAVVVQDVRGRYASEGDFAPFADDGGDGADTIAWVRAQPWCSGAVGMFGASYYGATQWRAAAAAGDALGAIAPGVTSADFHDGWAYRGGAFQLGVVRTWILGFMATGELVRRMGAGDADAAERFGALVQAIDDGGFARTPLAGAELPGDLAPYYDEWLAHPSRDDHWRALTPDDRYARVTAPALLLGGWYDMFLGGTLASWEALRREGGSAAARRPRLVIGPWAHGNVSGSYADRSYGFLAHHLATDPTGLHLRWFDRHLRGIENGIDDEPPVRIFVMGADEWRDAEDWPPPGTRFERWHLHGGGAANTARGDGRLSTAAPASEQPADEYAYDPRDPVPTVGGATFLPGAAVSANAGPRDQAPLAQRADVLTYVSEPLERDLEVIGPVELVLFASSSARDTDFTAKLVDVHPDGRAELLTDGILRARYRDSLAAPQPLEPGRPYELRIDLSATANVFRAGHRIRLDVSSSNFPRFDRNTNTGGAIASESLDDAVVAVNRVHHDAARPSHLLLPVQPVRS